MSDENKGESELFLFTSLGVYTPEYCVTLKSDQATRLSRVAITIGGWHRAGMRRLDANANADVTETNAN